MLNNSVILFNRTGDAPMTSGVSDMSVDFDWPGTARTDRRAPVLETARQLGLIGIKD
jgi:hypothetical protein